MKTLAARRPLPPYDSASPEGKRNIWGWWAFDWASQPYFTLGLTFISPMTENSYMPAFTIGAALAVLAVASVWLLIPTIQPVKPKSA